MSNIRTTTDTMGREIWPVVPLYVPADATLLSTDGGTMYTPAPEGPPPPVDSSPEDRARGLTTLSSGHPAWAVVPPEVPVGAILATEDGTSIWEPIQVDE